MSSSVLQSLNNALILVFHLFTANLFRNTATANPNLESDTMKHIVIVGGSYAGVPTAHRILKQAAKTSTVPFKITLVSRDSHMYWAVASPRAILPNELADDQVFQPIAPGFAQYPAGQFEFVLGSATGIDVESKQLLVASPDKGELKIDYDYLVLGTGSHTKSDPLSPYKSVGSTEATKEALHATQARVAKAKTIVIVGGGATGVETAGEIAFKYGSSKKVILITNASTLLDGRPEALTKTALKQLQALNVDVKLDTKVTNAVLLDDDTYNVTLASGENLKADMYLPSFGIGANTSYMPTEFLDTRGFVKVDEHLRATGSKDIFAIGDMSSAEPPQILFCEWQSTYMANQMISILSGKRPVPYKISATPMIGLQIGRKTGVGHYGKFKLPGFLIVMLRKTLFIERLPRSVDGSLF